MGQERQAGEVIPCHVCKVNPAKVDCHGVYKCWHCWLGERFNVVYPNGVMDEKDTEIWEENCKEVEK